MSRIASNSYSSRQSRLKILSDQAPLRQTGRFVEKKDWDLTKPDEPRALRGLARIIDGGLCHRCGSCVGICPTGVLGLDDEEFPTVKALSNCTDCDLCVKVCPGDEFDIDAANQNLFGKLPDITETHGSFLEGLIAYSSNEELRKESTSGGLVSAILLHLLETKQIDGAVVIAADPETLWKGKPIIARTPQEIMAAARSKYAISPTNAVFQEIREIEGRYALVGLPCQIHGFTKAAELDSKLKDRVVLTIGLFCHAAIEHEAFEVIWKTLGEKTIGAKRFISRVGKHPGAPHLELADGTLYPVYFGDWPGYKPTSIEMINILYRLYTPNRCMTCFDALSEYADIAVGDPWMAPPGEDVDFYKGWSFSLIRTERGRKIVDEIKAKNKIGYKILTQRETLACNTIMAEEKRWRAFRVIETHKRQGKPIPSYGENYRVLPQHSGLQFVKTELHIFSHIFCFLPKLRAGVLRFVLGRGGYWLLWLNHKRRTFRFWRRDNLEKIRRYLFGRE